MNDNGMHRGWRDVHPAVGGLRIAGLVVLGVIGAALFALVFGWFVMLLWNWLMPAIFHLGEITYWQAFGIVILAKLIFGSLGGPGRHGGRGHHWKGGPWHGEGAREECGDRDRWRYWRDYWTEEGKDAFARYVEKRKSGGDKGSGA